MTDDPSRAVVIFLALVGVTLIIALDWWVAFKRKERKGGLTFGKVMRGAGGCVVLLCIAYGSLEAHAQNIPTGPRNWILAGGLTWLCAGVAASLWDTKRKGPH